MIVLGPGQKLGAYQLIDRLGAGGMGEVWSAEDPRLGRTVAIKILAPTVAADKDAILRMQREARTAAQLYHPNIATIHSIEEDAGLLFIVMEYVQGDPLSKQIRARSLSEADVCRIARGVADALAEAHEKGIVHRDIKPDNIMVNGQRVKVLDFGVAKRVGLESTAPSDAPTAFVTQQGMIVGTVHYMSPEQALGKPLDARSDIFSLGVVMYEAITGRLPFGGETITETITQIIRDEQPPPIRFNPAISPGFNAIIQRCLRKNREERYASAAELSSELDQQLAQAATELFTAPTMVKPVIPVPTAPATVRTAVRPEPKKRGWLWGVVAALVVLLALTAFAVMKARQSHNVVQAPVAAPATAPPPVPAQTAVNVTAPPQVDEEESEPTPTETTAPAPATEEEPKQAPPPPAEANEAKEHFHIGQNALLDHELGRARHELKVALNQADKLDDRERRLAEIGLAISTGDRRGAADLGREFQSTYPNDPDFERIKGEFVNEPPPRPFFPRRRRGRL
jgi:hypothetical protein